MTSKVSWTINPESLDTSVASPRVITTGKQITDALGVFNNRIMSVYEVYKAGLENSDLAVFDDAVFYTVPPTPLLPPLSSLNRDKYRTSLKGLASDVEIYRVLSEHRVESERYIGQSELELTDAVVDTVSRIDKESSYLLKNGRKIGDIILGARQYYESTSGTKVIVCQVVLEDVEINILERTGLWSDVTINGTEISSI